MLSPSVLRKQHLYICSSRQVPVRQKGLEIHHLMNKVYVDSGTGHRRTMTIRRSHCTCAYMKKWTTATLLGDESTQQKSGAVTSSSLLGLSSHTTLWFCNSVLQERPASVSRTTMKPIQKASVCSSCMALLLLGEKDLQGWCIPSAELQDVHIQGRVQAQ